MDGSGRGVPRAVHLHLPSRIISVTQSVFYFQDKKKKKVPSDLEKVSVLWVQREGREH